MADNISIQQYLAREESSLAVWGGKECLRLELLMDYSKVFRNRDVNARVFGSSAVRWSVLTDDLERVTNLRNLIAVAEVTWTGMTAGLLPDPLWDLVEPFLPIPPRRPEGGRPRVSDRACLTGIVFVLRSGIPWQMLPQELGCGSGMTCWRRLRDWQEAGVWDLIHFALLDWLARDGQIDWSRAVMDSCSIRAVYGGDQTGPNPTDRAKRGSKRHLICDGRGVPLAVRLTGANRNDSQEALALVDAIPPLHGEWGRPRQRPDCVLGDRGYDAAVIRRGLWARHIVPWVAMRRTAHGSGLGRWRWVVERTFAWLNQFRRLRVRYDKRADIHEAFLSLGCSLICWQSLRKAWRTA